MFLEKGEVMADLFFRARELTLLSTFIRLSIAVLLGGIVGMERGRHGRAAGMRTHILVCLGATLTALVGVYTVSVMGYATDPLRIGAQVISGIGFLGAGTILIKDRFQVTGLTTAAGLWATAAVGLSTGIGFYEASIITTVFVLAANGILPKLEHKMRRGRVEGYIYVELNDVDFVMTFVDMMNQIYQITSIQIVPPRSGIPGHVGAEVELISPHGEGLSEIYHKLSAEEYISFALDYL